MVFVVLVPEVVMIFTGGMRLAITVRLRLSVRFVVFLVCLMAPMIFIMLFVMSLITVILVTGGRY